MTGVILEIASGSGEHIVHFARNFPALVFQPELHDDLTVSLLQARLIELKLPISVEIGTRD